MTGLELLLSLGLLCAFAGAAVLSPWFTRLEREKDAAVQRSFAMEVAVLLGLSDAAPDAGRVSGTYRGHPLTVRVVAYVTHGPAFPMGRTVAADVTIGPSVPEEAPAWAIRPAFEEHTYGPPRHPDLRHPARRAHLRGGVPSPQSSRRCGRTDRRPPPRARRLAPAAVGGAPHGHRAHPPHGQLRSCDRRVRSGRRGGVTTRSNGGLPPIRGADVETLVARDASPTDGPRARARRTSHVRPAARASR